MNQEPEITTLPLRLIVANFRSRSCECGKLKQENTAFCGSCYRSLPPPLKNALWRRFGQGFERAYEEARAALFGQKETA